MTQENQVSASETKKTRFSWKKKPISRKTKYWTLAGLALLGITFSSLKYSEIQDSLGYRTPCQSFEFRKFTLYLKQLLVNKQNQLGDNHFLQPLLEKTEQTLTHLNGYLQTHDDHYGDQVLDYAVEELDDWYYSTEGGDTVFYSEIMPDHDATMGLWSTYVASLHGLNNWDFSIHVIHVTEKTVADVNQLIHQILPEEGQTLIDAISIPGFEFDSFHLEGRQVDLGVYHWGIEFLFYLPTDENPLEKE